MHIQPRLIGVIVALCGTFCAQLAFATNGYMPHGIGAKNKAMAGAGMAMPEDAISIVSNPAAAVLVENRMDAGISLFMPRRNYTTLFGGNNGRNDSFSFENVNLDSGKESIISAEIAGAHPLANDAALAWAFYMRNGLASSFKGGSATFDPDGDGPLGIDTFPGTYGDGELSFELSQALLDITWAKQFNEQTSLGVSAVLAAQSLKVRGIGGFSKYTGTFAGSGGAALPGNLSGKGKDTGYGVGLKAGLHHELGEHFSLGASYQSEINTGSFSDYSDLLAGGGDLDIPAWAKLGVTWRPVGHFSLSVDLQYIWYSGIDALGNPFANIYDCPTAGRGGTNLKRCLGGADGPGFGWQDMPVVSIGSHWDINGSWTLRAGFSFADQPVPYDENTFNIPVISLTEAHYTFGFSRRLANGDELSFAFMYTEEESLEQLNQLDDSQIVRLTTDQFDFQLSYSWGL
jgi:long-chain fatty acid transport protein